MGESLFKLGRYNRVFLEIWAQIPIRAPILKQWAVGSFFSRKYSRRAHRDPQTFSFFIKTNKWEKWWSWWLRMTNAFILCNLLWKVQKNLAANRERSFKWLVPRSWVWFPIEPNFFSVSFILKNYILVIVSVIVVGSCKQLVQKYFQVVAHLTLSFSLLSKSIV